MLLYLCYRNFTLHSDCLGIVTIPEIYNIYPHNPVFFLTTTLFFTIIVIIVPLIVHYQGVLSYRASSFCPTCQMFHRNKQPIMQNSPRQDDSTKSDKIPQKYGYSYMSTYRVTHLDSSQICLQLCHDLLSVTTQLMKHIT